jgi:acetoacetyl-CoA synthetase
VLLKPPYTPQITLYQAWLKAERGLSFGSYDALWRWSVTDLNAFWQSVWDYFDLQSPTTHSAVLNAKRGDAAAPGRSEQGAAPTGGREPHEVGNRGGSSMIDAKWFVGAQVNYAQQMFRHVDAAHAAGFAAIISHNEKSLGTAPARELSWPELRQQVASLALHLRAQGVQPGDRVAAYLPNIPEAIIAFFATASIGGIWSICAPDMGTNAVLDRFRQIEPKVLFAVDGVRYGGRDIDRRAVVSELCAGLPTLTHVITLADVGLDAALIQTTASRATFQTATSRNDAQVDAFEPLWLPFDHPLWIVYSSGTTGLPKPIVHGHGGTMIVAMVGQRLHNDIACSYDSNSFGERFHWYSSTGWVMWNAQLNGLLFGATCCIFDGNPAGPTVDAAGQKLAPDWTTLWRFAAELKVTYFGAGAAFFANCMKAGVDLSQLTGLAQVRALGTTGSPLSEDAQNWGTEQFRKLKNTDAAALGSPEQGTIPSGGREPHALGDRGGDMWWCNISGGTDFAGAFIGGNRELPLIPGEMQCRLLGCAVEAWNEQGAPVIGEVGELVCKQPIPSMPLYFWGDAGHKRYLSSYFDMYPGTDGQCAPWRHGDWLKINPHGGCVIYGRSDATINRHGLRMGTSELYSAVEALPEVLDSMVVDLEYLGRESYMPLFVVLRDGLALDERMRMRLNDAIKTALSPRFVPNDIFHVAEIPRTLSGKKQELPIKKLLLGQPIERVINKEAMANPACLDWYVAFARRRATVGVN